ncbi:MAG: PD-(D/E)XK nuclease family protein [Chitinophagaceae bacterium]|jgi:hypothetical protein|nr:PD-(D/E)XK nuclease family protein [Chitinophagaceae bacterium]MBK7678069.1 PD-(D/E)XK nuclease family protein [Chitinophagaceae bacterium]MBK9466094.1 PD-(D/E)XK nuclease family protein [Chitinophagaceae bacterium]
MKDVSVFSRVFSYRQRETHSPLENFLTEIFAFCIETDLTFRKDIFLKLLKIKLPQNICDVTTQVEYDNLGRPDIEVCFDDTAIIFECKVQASERPNQLSDYATILTNHKLQKDKHLVFLTKYFEHREFTFDTVKPHMIRWFEVHELINTSHSEITNHLKSFLKDQEMEKVQNFTIQDMLAIKTIPETITKMEEVLEQLRPEFEKHFGGYSREKHLNYSYNGWSKLKYETNDFYIVTGFRWDWEDEIPYFGLWLNLPKKKFSNSKFLDIIQKELIQQNEWSCDEDDMASPYLMKPISEFIDKEEDCIPAMKRFVQQNLKAVYELRKKYPKLIK